MCKVLGVSRSTFYRWLNPKMSKSKEEQLELDKYVLSIYNDYHGIYGAEKIRRTLINTLDNYRYISIKRVQKSMKRLNIRSITVRKFKAFQSNEKISNDYPNHLKQNFSTSALNQKWVADITYIDTCADGWCYLSTVMDLHSKKIIGYHFDKEMTTDIVIKALNSACLNRKWDRRLILHTDLGSQYTSLAYEQLLTEKKIKHSYSRKGCPYDNAGIESFHASLKKEHVYQHLVYRDFKEAKQCIFRYVHHFYNGRRIHGSINYLTPNQMELNQHSA